MKAQTKAQAKQIFEAARDAAREAQRVHLKEKSVDTLNAWKKATHARIIAMDTFLFWGKYNTNK
jgi:hypothetical protein